MCWSTELLLSPSPEWVQLALCVMDVGHPSPARAERRSVHPQRENTRSVISQFCLYCDCFLLGFSISTLKKTKTVSDIAFELCLFLPWISLQCLYCNCLKELGGSMDNVSLCWKAGNPSPVGWLLV